VFYPSGISLSEFVPYPKTVYSTEWVELANHGDTPADLSGWALDDGEGGGAPYRLPDSSTIASHGLLVVELPKALLNNGGDTLRLLRPDGSVADMYGYAQAGPDQSFCRVGADWEVCEPTPNAPNQAALPANEPVAAKPAAALAPQEDPISAGSGDSPPPATASSTPQLPAWSNDRIAGAPPYADTTAGMLYRGLVGATSSAQPTTNATATPEHLPALAAPQAEQSDRLPLNFKAGLLLCALGAAVAGYNRLRSSHMRQPNEPPPSDAADIEANDAEITHEAT
jgi:hypothetical protein